MPTLTVSLADAPTDVLVHLVDHGPGTCRQIADIVPPEDAPEPYTSTLRALRLLLELGYVTGARAGHIWSATAEGRAAIANARAQAEA